MPGRKRKLPSNFVPEPWLSEEEDGQWVPRPKRQLRLGDVHHQLPGPSNSRQELPDIDDPPEPPDEVTASEDSEGTSVEGEAQDEPEVPVQAFDVEEEQEAELRF